MLFRVSLLLFLSSLGAQASVPDQALLRAMSQTLLPLQTRQGWKDFLTAHRGHCSEATQGNPLPPVRVNSMEFRIAGNVYKVGLGCRAEFIAASPKTLVDILNSPQYFQALYALDKPANVAPVSADGTFEAHIFKLVPGIETQDYTLRYTSHWDSLTWIQHSGLVRDERGFALRDNIKIVEPYLTGSKFSEINLFYPKRWWARLFEGTVRTVTVRELTKLNKSMKCAAERVQSGTPMSDALAKACQKESLK